VERLAKSLVKLGHEVTVLTSQYEKDLPNKEIVDGVKIVRAPVLFRISKGVIMPTFGWLAWKLVSSHDVVHLHLPQFDAAGVAFRGWLLKKPSLITYHCDLRLPNSLFNRLINPVIDFMNLLAGILADRICAYTDDFASHSPYLQRFADKVEIIYPPVVMPSVPRTFIDEFCSKVNPEGRFPVIGMATRFASEKGVEILLNALPEVMDHYPNTLVLYAGQYLDVMGEGLYFDKLYPGIQAYQQEGAWSFLGVLNQEEIAAFYSCLDLLVIPSLNSTETFGLVQIEAMIQGTPTIASNLPGVRVPSKLTGMGEVVPIGDSKALAEAIQNVISNPEAYRGDPPSVAKTFDPLVNASAYVELFKRLEGEIN
jgi:glycosyltransferase involved in cell wall biosynthesis